MSQFLCPTPGQFCSGHTVALNKGLAGGKNKAHSSRKEAMRCFRNYLIQEMGYKPIPGNFRELRAPDGARLILGRVGTFGTPLRPGKGNVWRPRKGGGAIT